MQSMPPPQVSMAHFLLVLLVFVLIFASVPVSDRQNDISDHLPECERISYIWVLWLSPPVNTMLILHVHLPFSVFIPGLAGCIFYWASMFFTSALSSMRLAKYAASVRAFSLLSFWYCSSFQSSLVLVQKLLYSSSFLQFVSSALSIFLRIFSSLSDSSFVMVFSSLCILCIKSCLFLLSSRILFLQDVAAPEFMKGGLYNE